MTFCSSNEACNNVQVRGVLGASLLGRVTRYLPGEELPCLECRWDDADYAALEQTYPCDANGPAPTTAPSTLGALVAALMAIDCRKLLAGEEGAPPPGTGNLAPWDGLQSFGTIDVTADALSVALWGIDGRERFRTAVPFT